MPSRCNNRSLRGCGQTDFELLLHGQLGVHIRKASRPATKLTHQVSGRRWRASTVSRERLFFCLLSLCALRRSRRAARRSVEGVDGPWARVLASHAMRVGSAFSRLPDAHKVVRGGGVADGRPMSSRALGARQLAQQRPATATGATAGAPKSDSCRAAAYWAERDALLGDPPPDLPPSISGSAARMDTRQPSAPGSRPLSSRPHSLTQASLRSSPAAAPRTPAQGSRSRPGEVVRSRTALLELLDMAKRVEEANASRCAPEPWLFSHPLPDIYVTSQLRL